MIAELLVLNWLLFIKLLRLRISVQLSIVYLIVCQMVSHSKLVGLRTTYRPQNCSRNTAPYYCLDRFADSCLIGLERRQITMDIQTAGGQLVPVYVCVINVTTVYKLLAKFRSLLQQPALSTGIVRCSYSY